MIATNQWWESKENIRSLTPWQLVEGRYNAIGLGAKVNSSTSQSVEEKVSGTTAKNPAPDPNSI